MSAPCWPRTFRSNPRRASPPLSALLVQLIPAATILFTSVPALATPLRKGLALLLLLVAPANPEVYLNTIQAQHVLCAAGGIILISEAGGRADRLGKWAVLGLAGLSGVACTFLAPLFWVQWWLERRRERLTQALILSACALLQLVFISQAIAQDERQLRFNSTAMVGAAYAKFIAMPLAPTCPLNATWRSCGRRWRKPAPCRDGYGS